MEVTCTVEYFQLESDHGPVDSVGVTCGRCDHTAQAYGDSVASVRRCLAMLRQECPNGERNFYRAEYGEDED